MKINLFIIVAIILTGTLFAADLWVPASAHAPGARETFWKSDLYVLNLSPDHCSLAIRYINSGVDQSAANLARNPVTLTLPPSGQAHILDLLGTYFSVEVGAGGLLFSGDCDFRIVSRTFTPAPDGEPGTFGQFIPGYEAESLLSSFSLVGAISSEDFRTNLGFLNTSQAQSAACTLTFRGADGDVIKTESVTFQPFVHVQYNDFFTKYVIPPQENVTIDITCDSPAVLGYLSTVDNETGDPVYLGGVQ